MNGYVIVTTAASAAAAAAYIVWRMRKNDVLGALLKTLASLCFCALGLVCAYCGGHTVLALPAVMAQTLCLAGDILLSINCGDVPASDLWTLGGLGSFLVGHVLFIAFQLAGGVLPFLPASILIGVLGGVFIYVVPKRLGMDFGAMRGACACYAGVIICSMALSLLRAAFQTGTGSLFFAVGYVLFVLSDIVLCFIMFEGKDTPLYNGANLTLYYSAQILISLSLFWC